MSMEFRTGLMTTAALGGLALILAIAGASSLSAALVASMDRTLLGDMAGSYQAASLAGQDEWVGGATRLDVLCASKVQDQRGLEELELGLRLATTPDQVFTQICAALAAYRVAAGAQSASLPLLKVPESQTPPGDRRISIVRLHGCDQTVATAIDRPKTLEQVPDLGWYEPECLLRRVRGVQPAATWFGFVLMKDAAKSGVEGTLYDYRHPRGRGEYKDPNQVMWPAASPPASDSNAPAQETPANTLAIAATSPPNQAKPTPSDEKAKELTAVKLALTRFDRLVLGKIRDLEKSVRWRRFLVRALADPIQFVIFYLGVYAAVLYTWMLAKTLAPTRASEDVDKGDRLRSYGTEVRNAVDAAHVRIFHGKVVADTLADWIPTLGFIGTVVGMIGAMDAVGAVVAAEPGPELFVAMSGVTSELSLAFYTTFVALVAGLVLSFLRRFVIARETLLVERAARNAT